jgi:hypothetical protein
VRNNLAALAETLCSPDIWGLRREACVVVADPVTAADMLDPVNQLAQQADDCLLLYYAGHGLIDASRGELHLALVGSDPRPERADIEPSPAHARTDLLVTLLVTSRRPGAPGKD